MGKGAEGVCTWPVQGREKPPKKMSESSENSLSYVVVGYTPLPCLAISRIERITYSPGGLVGGPRAYQYQHRGFESHRVHARRNFFCMKCKKIDY